MITESALRHKKISTGLTVLDNSVGIDPELQRKSISQWTKQFAKVYVSGTVEPHIDGARWDRTKFTPTIHDMLTQYVVKTPGNEIVFLGAPNVSVTADSEKFIKYVNSNAMGLAWAAYVRTQKDGEIKGFAISLTVVAHLIGDMPNDLTLKGDGWSRWIHAWMTKHMLRHRYFDATDMGVVQEFATPVVVPPAPAPTVLESAVAAIKAPFTAKKEEPVVAQEVEVVAQKVALDTPMPVVAQKESVAKFTGWFRGKK
jgi:hypothetical protein